MENQKFKGGKFKSYQNVNYSRYTTITGRVPNPRDSGIMGKCFEMAVKSCFGIEDEKNGIATASVADMLLGSKNLDIEIKSGCGVIAYDLGYEDIDVAIEKIANQHDYVIYIPSYNGTNINEARLMKWSYFIKSLEACGLIRSRMTHDNVHCDIAIQSFANSKKRTAMWLGCIYDDRYTRPLHTM